MNVSELQTKNSGKVQFQKTEVAGQTWDEIVKPGWVEKYADLSTGIRMCYCEIGPMDGSVILLIHGAGDSRVSWSRVAPILAEAGRRVIVAEMRGHGKTDAPKPERGWYLMEDNAEDMIALLDALQIEKADVVGHSCGSLTAQLIAAAHPERLRTVTLMATGATVELFKEVTIPEDMEPFDDQYCRDWAACGILDPVFAEATYQYVRQIPMDAWRWIQNGIKYFDSRDRLDKITCPVQIIWGSEDPLFNLEDQRTLQDGLVNTTVSFVEMTGCSHSPHWDSWKNVFAVAGQLIRFTNDYI